MAFSHSPRRLQEYNTTDWLTWAASAGELDVHERTARGNGWRLQADPCRHCRGSDDTLPPGCGRRSNDAKFCM